MKIGVENILSFHHTILGFMDWQRLPKTLLWAYKLVAASTRLTSGIHSAPHSPTGPVLSRS